MREIAVKPKKRLFEKEPDLLKNIVEVILMEETTLNIQVLDETINAKIVAFVLTGIT